MSEFKVGDRVRVTFEATVAGSPAPRGACLCSFGYNDGHIREEYLRQEGVTVEKVLPPPPEVFKPGDVVRALGTGSTYTLTNDGYVSHSTGQVWTDGAEWRDNEFTSKRYERVEL